jgi:hypothetical protein
VQTSWRLHAGLSPAGAQLELLTTSTPGFGPKPAAGAALAPLTGTAFLAGAAFFAGAASFFAGTAFLAGGAFFATLFLPAVWVAIVVFLALVGVPGDLATVADGRRSRNRVPFGFL